MSPVSSSSAGLSYLTQPGGLLSNLPDSISKSVLQSASPQDLATLGDAAVQAEEVDGLFGISPPSETTVLGVPTASRP